MIPYSGTKEKKKVYVAGKLSDDAVGYIKNMHNMIRYANEIRSHGFSVYVPCLDILMGLVFGDYEYNDYFNNSQPWLESSDLVFVIPGSEASNGVKKEIELAKALNIPVVSSVKDLRGAKFI